MIAFVEGFMSLFGWWAMQLGQVLLFLVVYVQIISRIPAFKEDK